MSAGGGPIGRREVAVRCFAAEYDDATLEYSEGDDERAPNYVVTPTGARINRLFVVGVLTEVEPVSDDVLRGRVVDPTGAFVVYAGQYQPDAKAALAGMDTPAFVALTGKARTFEPEDGDRVYTSVRPESVNAVDAATRDRWTVQAADQTLTRVETCAAALARAERGEALTDVLIGSGVEPGLAAGIPRAIDHYGTTAGYLAAVRTVAVQAAEVVAGEREEVEPLAVAPDEAGAAEADLGADVALAAPSGAASSGSTAAAEPGDEDDAVGGDEEPATSRATEAPAVDEGTTESPVDDAAGEDEDGAAEPDPDAGELYELDEDEREAIEAEYGTEFETGNEVAEPGESGIEPAGADGAAEPGETAGPEAAEGTGTATPTSEETEAGVEEAGDDVATATDDDGAGESDLVDAVVAAMADLDEGDGADHDAVVAAVADEQGVEEADVADAIEEALMGGRCYEPDDGRLKAI